MSGFAAIFHLDGAPVDWCLLEKMADFLRFRGPDESHVWVCGNVGMCHTLLRTSPDRRNRSQPFSLDGCVWIAADARVDDRETLIAKLQARGLQDLDAATTAELLLHAYNAWGERCVDHLLGDFAFVIWDTRRRHLFCARDQMGVKPLYWARLGQCIVVSNTLDCIRQHPAVSDRLNELAVADFLLFNLNQDKATTTFAEIQRVPPAHSATWSETGLQRLQRYWTFPIDEPIYYRRIDDYVDRFHELLRAAVHDRLSGKRLGIFMSGGLDSPTLAATAHHLLMDQMGSSEVCAFTTAYDGYDEEHNYADQVARSLGISIEFRGWSADIVDPEWHLTSFHTPEPVPYPASLAAEKAHHRRIASHSRVVFYGEGPDNALYYEWRPYISYLVQQRRFGRLLYDLYCHTMLHRRLPLAGTLGIAKQRPVREAETPLFPEWLNPELERRFQLRERWQQYYVEARCPHTIRPKAYRSFDVPLWQALFEGFDPARTGSLLEVRHPFVDLRFLRYMMAVPAIPWCRVKFLLRRSMRSVLPEPVLRRPKSPLVRDPWVDRVQECGLPPLIPASSLEIFVDVRRAQRAPDTNSTSFWSYFRTRSLNYWLNNLNFARKVNFGGFQNETIGYRADKVTHISEESV